MVNKSSFLYHAFLCILIDLFFILNWPDIHTKKLVTYLKCKKKYEQPSTKYSVLTSLSKHLLFVRLCYYFLSSKITFIKRFEVLWWNWQFLLAYFDANRTESLLKNIWQRIASSIKIQIYYTHSVLWKHVHSHTYSSSKVQSGLSFFYWTFDSLPVRLLSKEQSGGGSGSYRASFSKKILTVGLKPAPWPMSCL